MLHTLDQRNNNVNEKNKDNARKCIENNVITWHPMRYYHLKRKNKDRA